MASTSARSLTGRYNLLDYGWSNGESVTRARQIIQRAIDEINRNGGGVLELPSDAGTITIDRAIQGKDNVELHIPHGVTLRMVAGNAVGVIEAIDVTNIAITGHGVIDGNKNNQTAGNNQVPCGVGACGNGISMESVTDLRIEGVRIQNCNNDGLAILSCTRPRINVPKPRNSGRYDQYVTGWTGQKRVVVQRVITCAALSNTAVLASTALADGETTTVTDGITNPDEYRALRIVGNQAGITGTVTVNGTDWQGNAISEEITANGTTEVNGNKPFKTVTSIVLPAWNGSGDEISVGYCDKLGLHHGITDDTDVLEVARKATAASEYTIEALGTVSAVYGTVDQTATAVITGDDSFEITYLTWEGA